MAVCIPCAVVAPTIWTSVSTYFGLGAAAAATIAVKPSKTSSCRKKKTKKRKKIGFG